MTEPSPVQPVDSTAPRRRIPWARVVPSVLLTAFVASLILFVRSVRESYRCSQCESRLKVIQLALLNYHDAHLCFPPAYIADADGNPMHSWRVLVLPFIDMIPTYDDYDFTQPWNSSKNKKWADDLKNSFFSCPSGTHPANSYHTNYVVVTGDETAFSGSTPTKINDVKDRPENTILVVEIASPNIYWTEPRDLSFDQMSFAINDPAKPSISSPHKVGPVVMFAEGRSGVRLQKNVSPEMVKAMLTIAGGEEIDDSH
ncbi:MAG: DUF1559 domain-containing protein [Planctomycetaceae bacterium]